MPGWVLTFFTKRFPSPESGWVQVYLMTKLTTNPTPC